ncbi:MAG: sugar phosphate nucleotidyltransferase [Myxococcales bacterium]|nr:sugar phosphate nucleotidyltransferase [Myxococcales bacterium]
MAGGSGTRFWPRSRRLVPKQLLPVLGSRSLLQETVARLCRIVPRSQILIVTHRDHAAAVSAQLPELPRRNVLREPIARNTAPCLALAALEIERRAAGATFVALPADHAIGDARAFRATILEALAWARAEPAAVTIGIRPTGPETGYGYIALGARVGGKTARVRAFVEKPDAARARRFVASGRYLWNSGMFAWRASTLLTLMDEFVPEITGPLRRAMAQPPAKRARALARAYVGLPAISIDYGVMEHARDVLVVAGDFGWSDVGSWTALAALDGAAPEREVVSVDAERAVVFGDGRLVAIVGIDDVIVVDTPDAILVCHRERAQDVRRVVEELKRRKLERYV